MTDSQSDKSAAASEGVGYGRPPEAGRFKPGQSGNPHGRPRGAKGRRATIKRILLEKRKADPTGTGKTRQMTTLELVILLLKQLAATGDQRAYRALMKLSEDFGPQESNERPGWLVIPVIDTWEEWMERFGPEAQAQRDTRNPEPT